MAHLHRAQRLDKAARRFETKAFDLARSSEQAALATGRRWVTAVGRLAPFEVPAAQRVVNGMLDVAEDALTAPRQIAERMLHQVHDALGRTPPKTPASSAPRPARSAAPRSRTASPRTPTASPRPRTATRAPKKAGAVTTRDPVA